MNFVGAGLSFAYSGYGNDNPYFTYADLFKVSGSFGGTAKTYDLYIRNASGGSGTANAAPRGFLFNAGAPVVVPESGTLAFALPALGMIGAVLRRRRP